jgi:hypothetical protein
MTSQVIASAQPASESRGMTIKTPSPTSALLIGAAASSLAVLLLTRGDSSQPMLLAALLLTGRISFLFFVIAFGLGKWLGLHRRTFGMAFAGSHAVHAALIAALVVTVPGTSFEPVVLLGGGLGYVFLLAMAVTTYLTVRRWVGPARWQLLHTSGTWFLSTVFAYDFMLKPALTGHLGEPRYFVFAALLAAAYAVRLVGLLRRPVAALS